MMVRQLIGIALAAFLAGCAGGTPPIVSEPTEPAAFPTAAYQRLADDGGRVYRVDAQRSHLRVYLFRAGPLASAGHNHVIEATRFVGAFGWPRGEWSAARADLHLPVAALRVDPPGGRGGWSAAFGERPDAAARRRTTANLRGPAGLAAEAHPWIRVSLEALIGAPPRPIARFTVATVGKQGSMEIALRVERRGEGIVVSGRGVVRHGALGLTPYSALGGALKVADPMVIEFRLHGVPWSADRG